MRIRSRASLIWSLEYLRLIVDHCDDKMLVGWVDDRDEIEYEDGSSSTSSSILRVLVMIVSKSGFSSVVL